MNKHGLEELQLKIAEIEWRRLNRPWYKRLELAPLLIAGVSLVVSLFALRWEQREASLDIKTDLLALEMKRHRLNGMIDSLEQELGNKYIAIGTADSALTSKESEIARARDVYRSVIQDCAEVRLGLYRQIDSLRVARSCNRDSVRVIELEGRLRDCEHLVAIANKEDCEGVEILLRASRTDWADSRTYMMHEGQWRQHALWLEERLRTAEMQRCPGWR